MFRRGAEASVQGLGGARAAPGRWAEAPAERGQLRGLPLHRRRALNGGHHGGVLGEEEEEFRALVGLGSLCMGAQIDPNGIT